MNEKRKIKRELEEDTEHDKVFFPCWDHQDEVTAAICQGVVEIVNAKKPKKPNRKNCESK